MLLIGGATGTVGGEVVRNALEVGESVRALTRNPAAVAADAAPGVEYVAGDLNDPDSIAPLAAGVSGAFLLSGYADMPGLLAVFRAAGVPRVVLLSGSSADGGDPSNAISAYQMASEADVRASGLPWTILRPHAFHSNALRWLPQLRAGDVITAEFADVATSGIDPYDIGAVAVRALLSDAHEGQAYRLTGPEALRPADRVRILGEVLGRDLTFVAESDEDARARMEAEMPVEYVDAFFAFYVQGTLDESRVYPTVSDVLGRPPRTFEQWALDHASAFA
jgi:uncharacterized protein YbjT (DUF2867 family)